MVSVWLCLPSARPLAESEPILKQWKDKGYRVAVWRDAEVGRITWADIEHSCLRQGYPGYASTVNFLIQQAMLMDSEAEWFVAAGDDTLPDPHNPEEIAIECRWHFGLNAEVYRGHDTETFGVMQPTGDRFAQGSIDRIAGSPWIGREFARRSYGGNGPYWHEYRHMFVDEELMAIAQKLGVFWQRPDLVHLHRHFQRASDDLHSNAIAKPIPEHLIEANSPEHWKKYKTIFEQRRAEGFPGHEPL